MHLIDHLLERFGRFDDPPSADPLATALRPYEHADRVARIFDSLRADCEHYGLAGVDDAPFTPEKVWECDACGGLFRLAVNPEKPWFIRELDPVVVLAASHVVSGAAMPPRSVVALDAPSHIDLSDAS